jgi:hypothetical protein
MIYLKSRISKVAFSTALFSRLLIYRTESKITSYQLPSVALDEPLYRSIVGPFHIIWKKTGGKLFHPPVIFDTFTANTFSTARFISAVAFGEIFIDVTIPFFHVSSWLCSSKIWVGLNHLILYRHNKPEKIIITKAKISKAFSR